MREIFLDLQTGDDDRDTKNMSVEVEEESCNTIENALNCRQKLLLDYGCIPNSLQLCLVTSEYHMERAALIFECIFEAEEKVRIERHCAESSHRKCVRTPSGDVYYRKLEDREDSVDKWLLCERLDWERNALQTINEKFLSYGLRVCQTKLDRSLANLARLNETLQKG